MAGFQFPVDDLLLLLLLVAVPRESGAIRYSTTGCTECSVVFKSYVLWKLSRILHPQYFSQQGKAARKPNQTFLWVSSGLPPHLVEKLKHTIMGGSVEVSRHYYSRFSKLFSVCGSNQLRKNTSKTLLKFHMKNPSPGDVSKWCSATATRNQKC